MKISLLSLPSGIKTNVLKEEITLGRGKQNDIMVENQYVSSKHCKLFKKNNKFYIEDLNSSNGTFVNGHKITEPKVLKNKDTITLCPKGPVYQFCYTGLLDECINIIKNPKVVIPASLLIITILVLIFGIYFHYSKSLINIKTELNGLQEKFGTENFPENNEFSELLTEYVIRLKNSQELPDIINRKEKYNNLIKMIFTQNKVPIEFSYLAWVESRYDANAYNRYSGAKGMWQFMKPTARQYGLKINSSVDERINPEKSTMAASIYIKDLISIFGVNSLAIILAAYNAGDGAVRYALTRIKDPLKDRNFWYLYKNNLIPAETKDYVLKVLAVIVLIEKLKNK